MKGGSYHTPPFSSPIRIGQTLKNNESITYEDSQSPPFQPSNQRLHPYGAQIYLQPTGNHQPNPSSPPQLMQKYLMLCMELQRLTKLSTKHQTLIFNLTQQIQIRITDTESFRQREDILQRELKKIQEDDKVLLGSYHKLEQVLLEKNRLTGMLEEELVMMRNKIGGLEARGERREDGEDKMRIRGLEESLAQEKSRNLELDRQCKEAVINLERAEARMNTKLGTDRNLLLNAENRIKELEEQLRVYVSQKRLLEQNEIRFSQQNKIVDQGRYLEVMREVEEVKIRNEELLLERKRAMGFEREVDSLRAQLKVKIDHEGQFIRQIELLEGKLEKMGDVINDREKKILLSNNQKSELEYCLRTTKEEMKRLEENSYRYKAPETCKICSHFESQNKILLTRTQKLEDLIRIQQKQHRERYQQSQKQMKSLRELLQSVNNLKGSNERVQRLIEVSASKLMRVSSSKGFFSTSI